MAKIIPRDDKIFVLFFHFLEFCFAKIRDFATKKKKTPTGYTKKVG
jgi:hypothetical protein